MPHRQTFAPAFRAYAHSRLPALRRAPIRRRRIGPGSAGQPRRLPGHGPPLHLAGSAQAIRSRASDL